MDDIEAIKQLKARYCRLLDTKDWDGYRLIFTDDVVIDTEDSGGNIVDGADAFLEFLRVALAGTVTVHQCHTPEITITSPASATGIWAMEDRVRFPDGNDLTGFGHYHETYEKVDDGWRIKASKLTRLRMDFSKPDTA
nr:MULTISPECIES: nuclear transport factor 2 family protein [Pseudofrankia]